MSMAESFAATGFARFVNTGAGRVLRIVVGAALIWWGYTQQGTTGVVVMIVGLIPLVAGVFNLCIVSALLGGPIRGSRVAGGGA